MRSSTEPKSTSVGTLSTSPGSPGPLTEEMLARFSTRADKYDRENTFFTEDFEDLRKAGYLKLAVPAELGGYGLRLADE